MNRIHMAVLKKASLGDKEGLSLLTQVYYDTPTEGRAEFLVQLPSRIVYRVEDESLSRLGV